MEKPSSPATKPEEKPAIDLSEPKTLFEEEVNSAREAALEVISYHTKEEALKIFLKGLEPVGSAVKAGWDFTLDFDEEYFC